MPAKKTQETPVILSPDLQEKVEPVVVPDVLKETPKPKKESQKEPYKVNRLIADLGRSSCKAVLEYLGQVVDIDKLTSCVAKLDASPGNDYGGFTLDLEELHPTDKDDKGKPVKVKKQEHWVVGDRAQAYSNCVWMVDKSDAKVEYFHILLMGVISVIPNLLESSTGKSAKQRTLTIDLATLSIAKPEELKKKLKSCKSITVDGIKYRLNFTSNQQSFVEGHGAAIYGKNLFPKKNTVYVADFGAGTFQISEFSILNKLPSKKSKDAYHGGGGITSLKREVAKALANGDSANYLTRSQVSTLLEKSKWVDGRVEIFDFNGTDVSEQITTAITQWLRESPAGFALESLIDISRHTPIIFCGGGFAIAPVKEIIKKQILESGGIAENLIFPEDIGVIAVRGVLDYLTDKATAPAKVLELLPTTQNNANQQQQTLTA